MSSSPQLSAIVVHWNDEQNLRALVSAWPDDGRYELVVVDNSSTLEPEPEGPIKLIRGQGNLGFGGGLNVGLSASEAPLVLFLNSDVVPKEGSLEWICRSFETFPTAAGVVPALESRSGESQSQWQLQPLPTSWQVLLQAVGLGGARGPISEPAAGASIEQPAAAALALRRSIIDEVGGMDESFFPAWFEDVDLAARLAAAGHTLKYQPRARFEHVGGASVTILGYGPFLWIFHRNLSRYLAKHHGNGWRVASQLVSLVASCLRGLAICVRRPSRAANRREAFLGAGALFLGALSGWRRPRSYVHRFSKPKS